MAGFRAVLALAALGCLASCGPNVDENIQKFQPGSDVDDVLELLGTPDEIWGSVMGNEMVFVYEGKKNYSILFAGSFAVQVIEGAVGGKDSPPFSNEIKLVRSGDVIEFRRVRD